MSSPFKRPAVLVGAAVAALTVAGAIGFAVITSRTADAPAPTPAPPPASASVTPAEAAAPFDFRSESPYASVELTLPQALKPYPDLHARLFAAGVRDLRQFTEGSQSDRTEAGGDMGLGAYEKTIAFDTPVETGKLFSLARTDYEFMGGAHGMSSFSGVLWDKASKQQITAAQLFRTGADLSTLDTALCAALNAEKAKRNPGVETLSLGTVEGVMWSCPTAAGMPFVLAAGSTPGKAGGLTFLIGPYLVGSYAEGSFWVNVPQSAFRDLIAPAYADEFAGNPTPLPDEDGQ